MQQIGDETLTRRMCSKGTCVIQNKNQIGTRSQER